MDMQTDVRDLQIAAESWEWEAGRLEEVAKSMRQRAVELRKRAKANEARFARELWKQQAGRR